VVDAVQHHQPSVRVAGGRKIAVKVINHYGDEVLKQFDILVSRNKTGCS
jgi:hypothetical protein